MALRKAWQQMKRTLSSETRQFLVTTELWAIFLAKEQKDRSVIEELQSMTKNRLEEILGRIGHKFSSQMTPSNEKSNFKHLINTNSPY